MAVIYEILTVALAAAPWLLLGLFAAGIIKAFVSESTLQRWVGGQGLSGIARAAVIGAPLPLCSCGAIPTALALHRAGAGRGPTTAFLIGTPGIGVDSLAITYALLGPFMALARGAGAVVTGISTGLLVATTGKAMTSPSAPALTCTDDCSKKSACASEAAPTGAVVSSRIKRLRSGIAYAFSDLLDDISTWLLIGLVLAGVLLAFVPPQTLASIGSGLLPMLLMAVIGIPLYICATAATPVAAGMLMAGISPGTAIVFLLAGPLTSLATLGILRRELGNWALGCYLIGIFSTTVLIGLVVDWLVTWTGVEVLSQIGAAQELLPEWLEWGALIILVMTALQPVRRLISRLLPA